MKPGVQKKHILLRVYLLIALLLLMGILKAVLLTYHLHQQQRINDQVNQYYNPLIYHTENLTETIQELNYSYRLRQLSLADEDIYVRTLSNAAYVIDRYLKEIRSLETEAQPNRAIENARIRLENDINNLVNILNGVLATRDVNDESIRQLPDQIQSTDLRTQQYSRLLINEREEIHKVLLSESGTKTTFVILLITGTIIFAAFVIIPLVMNIRKMVIETHYAEHRQRKLRELAELEQSRLASLLSALNIGILFEDRQNQVEYVNPAFRHMWEIDKDKPLTGLTINQLLSESPHGYTESEHLPNGGLPEQKADGIRKHLEINVTNNRILKQSCYPVLDGKKRLLGRLWTYEDITSERQTAEQLLHLAEHDALTGLLNRHSFQKSMTSMIEQCRRENGKFSLLYFDLDEFKYINDTFGHGTGDGVLSRIANQVSTLIRSTESFARLGGDEFAILTAFEPVEKVGVLPERIISAISSIPFQFEGTSIRLTASIGIANYPDHGINVEDLVSHADTAMYEAKKKGKNRWALYNHRNNASQMMVDRMSWSRRIDLALQQDLLILHFQGVYNTNNHVLSHLEVLVRMYDPADKRSIIMPGEFIPIAEKTAQIAEIDRIVLAKSIATLAQYPHVPALAVNISGRTFDEPSLPEFIRERLVSCSVDPKRLVLELTETEAVSDFQDAQRFIETINQIGCRVCLDDFGNGFSTFMYLKYLNVQILKIDGMFIRDLPKNYENQVLVKAMVNIAQALNKSVVAEFVENDETLALLKSLGVQFAQGYYFDKPTDQHKAFL
ncbi:diguanylate cyclase (GGDEF) domain-containing protein [Nitrosomonas marina]|uniref:Diguanylate cyclase (GGDEF) domain-containing protein n=1 Tax=Nitrosomonas marina TaxID=917 RepID=A0A1I0CUZ0_9PROT|nr:EAL domain-containing protein [Nitrosomonas marina]SET23440.1 diguanylate cyclase (GGDEF) domain-containing protein [Nitrosomonas marina]